MKKISVIVPMFNSEKTIERCLKSILNQTFGNLEIILVDDNSNDLTVSICEKVLDKDNRAIIVKNMGHGVADGRNTGIHYATGDYIGFVDSDDCIDRRMYELLYEKIIKNDSDMSVCGFIHIENEKKKHIYGRLKEYILNSKEALKLMVNEKYTFSVCPWNKLIKKTIYEGIEYPKGIIYDDLATTYKLVMKSNQIVYFTQELYEYYVSDNSTSRKENYNDKVRDRIAIVDNMFKEIINIYIDLKDTFVVYKIIQKMSVINSMLKSSYFDKEIYENLKKEILINKISILKSNLISIVKKIQIFMLAISLNIYKNIYLKKVKFNNYGGNNEK